MLDRMTGMLQFEGEALALRAHRQQVLASNIANADTPGYQARDFDFGQALARASAHIDGFADGRTTLAPATGAGARILRAAYGTGPATGGMAGMTSGVMAAPMRTQAGFLPLNGTTDAAHPALSWRTPEQPALDRNTVDLDRERANFADNSLRYEATLRFINGHMRTMLTAIRGE